MPKSQPPNEWQPVAERIRERVDELGWTNVEFARQSGLSTKKLHEFLTGTVTSEPRMPTLRKIELALSWPAGAIAELRSTGDFTWPKVEDGRVLTRIPGVGGRPAVQRLETPRDAAERALAVSLTGEETEDEKRQILEALIVRAARELERLEASAPHRADRQ